MAKARILIVAAAQGSRESLRTILAPQRYELGEAKDGEEALARLRKLDPQVVLADVELPRMDGLTLLRRAREEGSRAVFLMMTASGSVEKAVEAMRAGAENYLVEPLAAASVRALVEQALEKARLVGDVRSQRERLHLDGIVGGPEVQAICEVVRRAATSKATVLILGEAGTGKELIAQALHQQSPRRDRPFVRVSCAALSETLLEAELFGQEQGAFTDAAGRRAGGFELADGGTLFLDDIGEIRQPAQVKLLRVLQDHEFERVGGTETVRVDVRLVAAVHGDLAAEVKAGRFREDLYYRLNVIALTLPPLRRRKGDIAALAAHFIEKYGKAHGREVHGLAPGALHALVAHDWPGNVRELANAIERAVMIGAGPELGLDDLPTTLRAPRPVQEDVPAFIPGFSLHEIEHEAIMRTLKLAGGSTSRTAEILGISVRKIQYRLKEYGSAQQGAPQPPPRGHES